MYNTIINVKDACTGCEACVQACPTKAIEFKPSKEGFLYPYIIQDKCINCGRCAKVCTQMLSVLGNEPKFVYAGYSKDETLLEKSSSGAIFGVVAKAFIENGGSVCAVTLSEDVWQAQFTFADTIEQLMAMRGSKYVQAHVGNVFVEVQKRLKQGKKVLFAGCGCHVAGLKAFLKGDKENLFTVDIICHGVPSPKLFTTYIKTLEKKGEIKDYSFRNKLAGWGMRISYKKNGKQYIKASALDSYNSNFLNCYTYRESCYNCKFACSKRHGDWTIGDYWGILKEHPEFYSEKGVSALLVNTQKGEDMFSETNENINYIPSTFNAVARHNENLLHPSSRPKERDNIYKGLEEKSPTSFVKENLKLRGSIKSIIKALIPWQVKKLYQKGRLK